MEPDSDIYSYASQRLRVNKNKRKSISRGDAESVIVKGIWGYRGDDGDEKR